MPDDAQSVRFLGLTLDLKLNVSALVAVVLSISSLVIQGVQILRGPQVTLSAGERVNLVRYVPPATPDAPYLIVNARLDYVNTGAVGRDAIIASERLVMDFDDLGTYEYRWLHFEMFVPDDSGGPKAQVSDIAHSFPVPGGSAATHQTTFVYLSGSAARTPEVKSAPVLWSDFLRSARTKRPIGLRLLAHDRRGGPPYEAACAVVITDAVLEALERSHWATALCEGTTAATKPRSTGTESPPAATTPASAPPPGIR